MNKKKQAKQRKPALKTRDVRHLLKRYFEPPSFAFLEEVRNQTGWGPEERYADVVAMSLWPSRGLEIHGVEIKVSRGDWLKELKTPEKSEPIQRYCDRWWIAVGDALIVKEGELPPTWGLLIPSPRGAKMRVKVQAPKLKPTALDRGFVASMLRRASQQVEKEIERANSGDSNEHYKKGLAKGEEQGKLLANAERIPLETKLNMLQRDIEIFEEVSGISIKQYGGHALRNIAESVKVVMKYRQSRSYPRRWQFRRALETFEAQVKAMRTMVNCIEALEDAEEKK